MSNIFLIFSNSGICERNNAKIIFLIIFYVFSLLLLFFFFFSNSNFTKKKEYVNIYGHILFIIIYVYICLYICIVFLYKQFFTGTIFDYLIAQLLMRENRTTFTADDK